MNLGLWQDRVARALMRAEWALAARRQRPPKLDTVLARASRDRFGGLEFVRRCGEPAYIEPEFGYTITAAGVMLEESLAPNMEYPKAPWRIAVAAPGKFRAARRGASTVVRVPSVISLRHFWEWNYYHFYLDTLGKLELFDEAGIDPATPIAVGRYVIELPFAEQALRSGKLRERNWLVQDNAYVYADEVYYCRLKSALGARAPFLIDQLGVRGGDPASEDRIFLTRAPGSTRSLHNADAVHAVLREYRFETVDTAGMTIQEQAALFGRARYLVALHGAGMTNLLFRCVAPMGVLELHGEGYRSGDFEQICKDLGFAWDHLGGPTASTIDGQFADYSIDPDALRQKLDAMLTPAGA